MSTLLTFNLFKAKDVQRLQICSKGLNTKYIVLVKNMEENIEEFI